MTLHDFLFGAFIYLTAAAISVPVAKRLGLKFAPKLKFRKDESFAEADRIEELLRDPKVARDLAEDDED